LPTHPPHLTPEELNDKFERMELRAEGAVAKRKQFLGSPWLSKPLEQIHSLEKNCRDVGMMSMD